MPIKEENELLVALAQQSNMLRRMLDDLHGVWSDEAARTLQSMHLSPRIEHDGRMLQALHTQTELFLKGDGWMDTANQRMTDAGVAHRRLKEHLLYAQEQMVEAEHKHRDALAMQQEVRDMLSKIQQLIQEAQHTECE